jgi:hypothetical protein
MGHTALIAALIRPISCLPSDVGHPDCPWVQQQPAATDNIDVSLALRSAVLAALLLLPVARIFVAVFDHIRPSPDSTDASDDTFLTFGFDLRKIRAAANGATRAQGNGLDSEEMRQVLAANGRATAGRRKVLERRLRGILPSVHADNVPRGDVPWALPHQLIGACSQFSHVENVRRLQAHSRGFLLRRAQQKNNGTLRPRVRKEEPVVNKDQTRLYPAPAVKHSTQLVDALMAVQRQQQQAPVPGGSGGSGGARDDRAMLKLAEPKPAVADADRLVESARPYPFRYARPSVMGSAEGAGDSTAHAWELEPSLLLPAVRASLGPNLSEFQRKILDASARRAGMPVSAGLEQPGVLALADISDSDLPEDSELPPQLTSSPSTPPSPTPAGIPPSQLQPAQSDRVATLAEDSQPPPPPPQQHGSSAARARSYRPTNAFALRVIEDEKVQLDLPLILKVQAAFRGNRERKRLRIERAIAVSRQVRRAGQIYPRFRLGHAPTAIREAAPAGAYGSSASVAGGGSKYRLGQKLSVGGRPKSLPPPGQPGVAHRSRFTDLSAAPRAFHHRRRRRVRRQQEQSRVSDEWFPQGFHHVAHAAVICWFVLCGGYASAVGIGFGVRLTKQWLAGIGVAMGWQLLVQEPLLVAAAVLGRPACAAGLGRLQVWWATLRHHAK